jgi:CDP-diacylglycerol---glycerol-3-phosphate 3-phosphatidyltransferase
VSEVDLRAFSNSVGRYAPNALTFSRFLVVPVFVLLLIDPTPQSSIWATALFLLAAVTDWLDGYLARLYQAESILGKMLDPLADKILVMGALVMLTALPSERGVPAWMVVILLAREMIITGLRALAAIKGLVVPASELAKHKTAWTFIAVGFLLIAEPYDVGGMLVNFHVAGMAFLWIALILSIISGLVYAHDLRSLFL